MTVWLGVTSLSQLFAVVLGPLMPGWPRHLQMLVIGTLTVIVLTWVVLPLLMRALQGWHFPRRKR